MRVLLILGISLIFLSAGSPVGIAAALGHLASYATEPEAESAETEEFSSQHRAKPRQRKPVVNVKRFSGRLTRMPDRPLLSTAPTPSSRKSFYTLHAVFRI